MKNVLAEKELMEKIKYPNILNLVNFYEKIDYVKRNMTPIPVVAIVMELARGGELWEYIAYSGRLSEDLSRYYFHQLIETLQFLHSNGVIHRDIKSENTLLDDNFNLKVADFGFTTYQEEGSFHKTLLGTPGYQAPEMNETQEYDGRATDLFAAGVFLYFITLRRAPFEIEPAYDSNYKYIKNKDYESFWKSKAQSYRLPYPKLSEDFKKLFVSLVAYDSKERYTIKQVLEDPWYNENIPTKEEVQTLFKAKKQKVDSQKKAIREKKLNEKMKLMTEKQDPRYYQNNRSAADNDMVTKATNIEFNFFTLSFFFLLLGKY